MHEIYEKTDEIHKNKNAWKMQMVLQPRQGNRWVLINGRIFVKKRIHNDKFWSKQKSSWENFQLDLPATSRQQENRRRWGKAKSNLKPECEIVRWKSRQRLNTGGQFFDIKIKEMEIGRVLQIGNWRSCFFCNWLFPERRRSYEDYPHFMRRLRTFIEGKAKTFYDFRRFL